ncbi:helix-turn-helix domain-containing protein [Brevibacterium sp. GP-SGM9]|uniref:helix-turn-helix domain-containing protein n=1 Tax=unclassified Brevibacterium TaxID=2614124 RepID=UPI001E47C018|nr:MULTISPECIES: helix-turn-helix transcriptional regulator [unclassified Brevibacterium]MCD1287516.1 AraC family transcriptional regulator [Brevibacterium sp. CCUG 69071]MDK8436678.1 helix-turn-helix transcriptional regulator [Brevibacterium sp. H-BE7]
MSAPDADNLTRHPHPRLREFVGDYVGYDISGVPAGTHLGLPSGSLTFILSIGESLHQYIEASDSTESFDVLLAGLHLRSTLIRHAGSMAGIQINFGPFATRAIFGIPAGDFAHRTYDLEEVSRPIASELYERVNAEPTWAARFDAIDEVLLRALAEVERRSASRLSPVEPRAELIESWRQIVRNCGGVPVAGIAEQVGWSRRHLNGQFTAEFGIGPKEAARVIRFDRARRMVAARRLSLAEISAACGYTDQAHLNREFRALSGTSPVRWLNDDPVVRKSPPEAAGPIERIFIRS